MRLSACVWLDPSRHLDDRLPATQAGTGERTDPPTPLATPQEGLSPKTAGQGALTCEHLKRSGLPQRATYLLQRAIDL